MEKNFNEACRKAAAEALSELQEKRHNVGEILGLAEQIELDKVRFSELTFDEEDAEELLKEWKDYADAYHSDSDSAKSELRSMVADGMMNLLRQCDVFNDEDVCRPWTYTAMSEMTDEMYYSCYRQLNTLEVNPLTSL